MILRCSRKIAWDNFDPYRHPRRETLYEEANATGMELE
jgi:hypothetical protein